MHDDLLTAINIWIFHLGGRASAATGHGIVFEEVLDPHRSPVYCNLHWDQQTGTGTKNPAVPEAAIRITYSRVAWHGAAATLGFRPYSREAGGDANALIYSAGAPGAMGMLILAHEVAPTTTVPMLF